MTLDVDVVHNCVRLFGIRAGALGRLNTGPIFFGPCVCVRPNERMADASPHFATLMYMSSSILCFGYASSCCLALSLGFALLQGSLQHSRKSSGKPLHGVSHTVCSPV
jgi:hypothetical protein